MTEDADARALVERMRAFAFAGSTRRATAIWLRQRGQMWRRPGGPALAFTAAQRIDAAGLGFRWVAHFRVGGFVPLTVVDAFEERRGFLEVRPFGIRVSRGSGPEFDEGEAQRFLAELAWCPFALDHPELEWSAVGESSVLVALGGARVTLHLDADGGVLRANAERPRTIRGGVERTRWRGEFEPYREFDGLRLPASARVFWDLPSGPFEYFRCEIVDARVIEA